MQLHLSHSVLEAASLKEASPLSQERPSTLCTSSTGPSGAVVMGATLNETTKEFGVVVAVGAPLAQTLVFQRCVLPILVSLLLTPMSCFFTTCIYITITFASCLYSHHRQTIHSVS